MALRILTKELQGDLTLVREKFYLAREYVYRKQWDTAKPGENRTLNTYGDAKFRAIGLKFLFIRKTV